MSRQISLLERLPQKSIARAVFFFFVEAFFLKRFSFQQIGPFETTSAELRELRTGRPYMVQVCAQELLGLGECSEWSEAVNVTVPKVKL